MVANRALIARVLPLAVVLLLIPVLVFAEVEIVLKNSFIEAFKHRAIINVNYIIDKAHASPNSPAKDGDMHVAGRADEIGLPVVAEIMNAKFHRDAVDLVHQLEGTGQTVQMSGAWRIWTEHAGIARQVQGQPLQPFDTTNPDHVFQIHPVTQIGDISLFGSFIPIEGYTPKEAHAAFQAYESLPSQIKVNKQQQTTSIVTGMGGFNYVEFILELSEEGTGFEVPGGRFVMAGVRDMDDELLVRNRRMVFVKGTPPELKVRTLNKGDKMHVLGMPRIDLALVSWRVRNSAARPEVLTWTLPYEIIVVGVYDE